MELETDPRPAAESAEAICDPPAAAAVCKTGTGGDALGALALLCSRREAKQQKGNGIGFFDGERRKKKDKKKGEGCRSGASSDAGGRTGSLACTAAAAFSDASFSLAAFIVVDGTKIEIMLRPSIDGFNSTVPSSATSAMNFSKSFVAKSCARGKEGGGASGWGPPYKPAAPGQRRRANNNKKKHASPRKTPETRTPTPSQPLRVSDGRPPATNQL